MKYYNAQQAFEHLYVIINDNGVEYSNTKTLFNVGFYIKNPLDNNIETKFRKWNHNYAEYEWQWYLSGNPNAEEISKKASIWKNHMDENGNVQSNYGWQWIRSNQLSKITNKLMNNKNDRQAVLTFYDGKEIENYNFDTPCTLSVHFQIIENELCMTVMMRSNDLWFGFCNDQYCFSKLQQMVAKEIGIKTGWYYHFASNLHLYNNFLNKNL
jgi:thymidylate synthase